jgi:hypothetical protein
MGDSCGNGWGDKINNTYNLPTGLLKNYGRIICSATMKELTPTSWGSNNFHCLRLTNNSSFRNF